jgi:deoxycytidylate deaminase
LRRYLGKCDILIVKRKLSNSKPCSRCIEFLKNTGIRRVYYSCDEKIYIEKMNSIENEHLSSKYRKPWSTF